MERVQGPGATIDNKFTEGDPGLGVPATTVTANILNAIQEELSLFIEAQGITLVNNTYTQLQAAMAAYLGLGGEQLSQTIVNNQASAADVTGLLFDESVYKAFKADVYINRETATNQENEVGMLRGHWDEDASQWEIIFESSFDDAGVTFSITPGGQVQYVSSNIIGGSYVGTAKITNIIRFAA